MTNTITAETLEQLLHWSAPSITTTARGVRQLRTAVPHAAFWGLWKSNKANLQDLGISPKPEGESWIIRWYQEPAAPAAAAARPFVLPETKYSWSDEQIAIFKWFHSGTGCRVVRARAGTGKTTTIKAAFSVAPEESMLYAVFNKKNQVEASQAITDPRVEVKTLHSVGFMFIQQVWPNAKPTDEVETDRVERVVGQQNPKEVKTQVKKLVGFAKNTLINPTLRELMELAEDRDIECPQFEAPENGGWDRAALSRAALQVLEVSKVRDPQGRISFNDMVWLPVAMNWTRAWYDMVVIDEAQDMNLPQLTMARAACKHGGRICVVGDDRQAIYGFRGAVSDGMDMMLKALNAQELSLTITYRCPKKVVEMASKIVPDYRAADAAPDGEILGCEASAISTQVKIGDAVLSRSNAPLMSLCLSLLRKGIPARIEGRDIGKALAEIVEKLKARSVPDFLRKVDAWAEKQTRRFEDTKNFEQKAEQIQDQADTLRAIAEGASSVKEITNRLTSLFQNSEDNPAPSVVLSTTHKAKGLEWSKVYILTQTFNKKRPVGAPQLSPEAEAAQAKEEANIYYVAITRAKATLVLATGEVR